MPRWVPPILILFVVFFILSAPDEAGPQTRSFFSWIGEQASNAGTFLDGLFDNEPDQTGTETTTTTTTAPTTTETTAGDGDAFDNSMRPIVVVSAAA